MSNTGKVFNFIQFSEINENLNEEDVNQTPAPTEAPLQEPSADAGAEPTPGASSDGTEGSEGAEGQEGTEGGPQILKVYTDSEEDIQELKDAGIEIGGEEGQEGTEGAEGQEGSEGAEGAETEVPNDVLYIKIKTEDGEDVILPFKERSEESRQPVEGEENTFDTELVATHNDYEFSVTAEIKVNPSTGEEEKPEVQEGEPVEEKPAEEGSEGGEGTEGEPATGAEGAEPEETPAPNESFAFEQKIMSFTQFVNESKREQENYKKGKEWEKALKAGKKKDKKKK